MASVSATFVVFLCGSYLVDCRASAVFDSHHVETELKPRRTETACLSGDLSDEVAEVNILPVTPDHIPVVHCARRSANVVSCRHNDLLYSIKMKHSDLSDEALVLIIRALYQKLSGANHVQNKRLAYPELVTVVSPQCKPPLVIVLPAEDPPKEKKEPRDDCRHWTRCEPEPTSCRTAPIDGSYMIECCPVDFEPVSPDMPPSCNATLSPSKRPNAYIYSCKWQGKREVERDVFLVPVDPPKIHIAIEPDGLDKNFIPVKISLEE